MSMPSYADVQVVPRSGVRACCKDRLEAEHCPHAARSRHRASLRIRSFFTLALNMRKREQVMATIPSDVQDRSLGKVREEAEREHILSVLKSTDGNRVQAARILGISRKTLWKKLKRLGISWPPHATER